MNQKSSIGVGSPRDKRRTGYVVEVARRIHHLKESPAMKNTLTVSVLTVAALHSIALAQIPISPINKMSWSENAGWMNWRDAGSPAGTSGVRVGQTHLSGMIWSENIGWINMGDGTPANGTDYANLTGTDFGVNVESGGGLAGMAWAENTGWVNFDTTVLGAQRARLDQASGRFRGYAWSENLGWINLDNATHFVGVQCPADFNQDGTVDFFDYLDFVSAFSSEEMTADINADAIIDFFDYLDFVAIFSTGC